MKTVIYYFTGTGNSLAIARYLAAGLEDAEVLPMVKLLKEEELSTDADRIGLVFPVYYYDLPEPVREFLQKLTFEQKNPYIFAVIHYGGEAGNTLSKLDKLLQSKGERLAVGFEMLMPDNSVFLTTPKEEQRDRLEQARKNAERITAAIRQLKTESVVADHKLTTPIYAKGTAFLYRKCGVLNKKACDVKRCNQCGICARVCPVENVQLTDGRVIWGDRCGECFACIQWCPHQAIRFGWLRVKETYRHPEVTVKDMMEQAGL